MDPQFGIRLLHREMVRGEKRIFAGFQSDV